MDRRAWRAVVHVCVLNCFSHVRLFATPWTVACQPPQSIGFQRIRHDWSDWVCMLECIKALWIDRASFLPLLPGLASWGLNKLSDAAASALFFFYFIFLASAFLSPLLSLWMLLGMQTLPLPLHTESCLYPFHTLWGHFSSSCWDSYKGPTRHMPLLFHHPSWLGSESLQPPLSSPLGVARDHVICMPGRGTADHSLTQAVGSGQPRGLPVPPVLKTLSPELGPHLKVEPRGRGLSTPC